MHQVRIIYRTTILVCSLCTLAYGLPGTGAKPAVAIAKPAAGQKHFENANYLSNKNQFKEALVEYNRARRSGFREPVLFLHIGHTYARMLDTTRALEYYTRALELDPNFERALIARASTCALEGQWRQAANDARKAHALNPSNAKPLNILGFVSLLGLNDYKLAVKFYTRSIELNPAFESYEGRARAYEMLGEKSKSLRDWDRALVLKSRTNSRYIQKNKGNYIVTHDSSEKEPENSRQSRAIESDMLHNRGTLLADSGYYEEAIEDLYRSSVMKTKDPESSSAASDARQAIKRYSKLIQLYPKNPENYYYRATARMAGGSYNEAAVDFNRFLSLNKSEGETCWAARCMRHVALRLSSLGGSRTSDTSGAVEGLDLNSSSKSGIRSRGCWFASVASFLNGAMSEVDFLTLSEQRRRQTCARYFVAMKLKIDGKNESATKQLLWIQKNGDREAEEYQLALAELNSKSLDSSILR